MLLSTILINLAVSTLAAINVSSFEPSPWRFALSLSRWWERDTGVIVVHPQGGPAMHESGRVQRISPLSASNFFLGRPYKGDSVAAMLIHYIQQRISFQEPIEVFKKTVKSRRQESLDAIRRVRR